MGTHRDPSHSSGATLADATFYRDHGYWPVPRLVQWMVTQECSLDCGHCLAKDGGHHDELTLTEATDLLDQIATLGVPDLLLTGGEPLHRADFPAIVERLAERRQRWSLNTAVVPGAASEAAMRQWPPSFVAVSLDGPEDLHDRFRGRPGAHADALRAIALYAELTGGAVTAGTTVTRQSFDRLDETFRDVLQSAATGWGIHLVFPEGRAANQPELRLTRTQTRQLLEFVASRRQHFPVTLADELGYCGEWEPLVRDGPFTCGAGRAQCVVLADGHVVPCTTTDHTASAGTIRERSLADIWRDGFAELRRWTPDAKCSRCEYLPACGGGCWLQRRQGLHCFRPAWHRPRALSNAAGVAVCLGLAACSGSDPTPATVPTATASPGPTDVATQPPAATPSATAPAPATPPLPEPGFDVALARCMVATLGPGAPDGMPLKRLTEQLAGDPAKADILALVQKERSEVLAERVALVRGAQKTQRPSLTLAALLWRELSSWAMDCKRPEDRSDDEKRLLREALGELHTTTAAWRLKLVRQKLDPYLVRQDATVPTFMMTKALTKRASVGVYSQVAFKRWAMLPNPQNLHQLTKQFLEAHPFAWNLRLELAPTNTGVTWQRVRAGKTAHCAAPCALDIFDGIVTPTGSGTTVVKVTFNKQRLAVDQGATDPEVVVKPFPGQAVHIKLPLSQELTYADVVRLGHVQNAPTLRSAYGTPFELAAARHRLLEQLARTPQDPKSVDRTRWDLIRAWLF